MMHFYFSGRKHALGLIVHVRPALCRETNN